MATKAKPQTNPDPAPEKQEPARERIFVRGEVLRDPTVTRLEDNRLVAHVDIKPEEVQLNGVKVVVPHPDERSFRATFWGAKAVRAEETMKAGALVEMSGTHDVREYKTHAGQPRTVSEIKHSREIPLEHSVVAPAPRIAISGKVAFQPELKMSHNKTFYTQVAVDPDDKSVPRHSTTFYGPAARQAALEINRGDSVSLEGRPVQREWEGKTYHEVQNATYQLIGKEQTQALERSASR